MTVGVVAGTLERAKQVISELAMSDAIPLAANSNSGRGYQMRAILVDSTALPLAAAVRSALMPCLMVSGGPMYELTSSR